MRFTKIIPSLLISSSAFAASAPDIRFSGVCKKAKFEILSDKIIYSKLGLQLREEKGRLASAECIITSTLPAKAGYRINVSEFDAEANAVVLDPKGFASLFVNHRFNGEDLDGLSSISRKDGKLSAKQKSGMVGECNQEAVVRSKLTLKAKHADLKFGVDGSDAVTHRYTYSPCD